MFSKNQNYQKLREEMVKTQLIERGIKNKRVLEAFLKVPREKFFPENLKDYAYADGPFPIGEGQTISQPYMVAIMTEYLDLKGTEKVLEIGTGSGYQTAILAELAWEVYSVERIKSLSKRAQKTLAELNYSNCYFLISDGTYGWPEKSPFDRIIVTASAREIPPALIEQLSDKNGILVIPVGSRGYQVLKVVHKNQGKIKIEEATGCVFVPLVGEYETLS